MAKWHDIIGEPTYADAILDRIIHNAYRLELNGPSVRKLKADAQAEPEVLTVDDSTAAQRNNKTSKPR